MKIHKRILELRPEWTEKVKVVMTSGNKDPEEWADIIGGKAYKKELAKKFKDENDTMKIAIVVDMWLTGFDVPSLATMYVYKPMKDHNLMQAIARVNRVFPEKAGGLIVDYVGISDDEALAAFRRVSELEGVIPALESSHALAYLEKLMPTTKEDEVVVVCLSGRGDKDVQMVAKVLGEEI